MGCIRKVLIVKKVLSVCVATVFALLLVVCAGGYLLPSSLASSASVVIDAPAEKIFLHGQDLHLLPDWNGWMEKDPSVSVEVKGAPGVGQTLSWKSSMREVGEGQMTIVSALAFRSIVYNISIVGGGGLRAEFHLASIDAGARTRVTWSFEKDLPDPLLRWMGFFVKSTMTAYCEETVHLLKRKVERGGLFLRDGASS